MKPEVQVGETYSSATTPWRNEGNDALADYVHHPEYWTELPNEPE